VAEAAAAAAVGVKNGMREVTRIAAAAIADGAAATVATGVGRTIAGTTAIGGTETALGAGTETEIGAGSCCRAYVTLCLL